MENKNTFANSFFAKNELFIFGKRSIFVGSEKNKPDFSEVPEFFSSFMGTSEDENGIFEMFKDFHLTLDLYKEVMESCVYEARLAAPLENDEFFAFGDKKDKRIEHRLFITRLSLPQMDKLIYNTSLKEDFAKIIQSLRRRAAGWHNVSTVEYSKSLLDKSLGLANEASMALFDCVSRAPFGRVTEVNGKKIRVRRGVRTINPGEIRRLQEDVPNEEDVSREKECHCHHCHDKKDNFKEDISNAMKRIASAVERIANK